jgi:hypothetical protein
MISSELLQIDSQIVGKARALVLEPELIGPRVFHALVAGVVLQYKIPVIITADTEHFQSLGITTEPLQVNA